jgi:hypothetical protein
MPILTATGAVVDHVCANCGNERHLTPAQWVVPAEANDVFSTPPCTCGATESFSWHDWVYLTPPQRPADLAPEEPFDHSPKPDHTHDGARQMVLIERVATALGRSKRSHPEAAGRKYAQAPAAPTQASVRAYVARLRGET